MTAEIIPFPKKTAPAPASVPDAAVDMVRIRAAAAVAAFGFDPAFLDPSGRIEQATSQLQHIEET